MTFSTKRSTTKVALSSMETSCLRKVLGQCCDGTAIYDPAPNGYSLLIGPAASGKSTGGIIPNALAIKLEGLS